MRLISGTRWNGTEVHETIYKKQYETIWKNTRIIISCLSGLQDFQGFQDSYDLQSLSRLLKPSLPAVTKSIYK